VGGDPFHLTCWVNRHPLERNRRFRVSPISRFPMSLRWSSYVVPKPPKGAQKCKTAVFGVKSHFAWRKSATKFLYIKTVSDEVARHSFAYLSVYQWLLGTPLLRENLPDTDPPRCKTPIFNLFSLVRLSRNSQQKTSINTNRKFTSCFPMSLRWIVYVDPKLPKGGSKTQSVQNLNNNLQ